MINKALSLHYNFTLFIIIIFIIVLLLLLCFAVYYVVSCCFSVFEEESKGGRSSAHWSTESRDRNRSIFSEAHTCQRTTIMPRKKSAPLKGLSSEDERLPMGTTHKTPKFIPTMQPPATTTTDKKSGHFLMKRTKPT